MANTKLKLKKSSVAGRIPVAGDLEYGELAINYRDGKLYYKDNANAVQAFNDSSSTITLVTNLVDSDYITSRVEIGAIGDANTVILNEYTGDSSATAFTLTQSPATDQHAIVMVDGVVQQVNNYSLIGSQLTLDEAPITGAEIEVRTLRMQTGNVTVRDFTATNGTSVTLLGGAATSGDTVNINSYGISTLNGSTSKQSLPTTGANQVVDTFNKTVSRTAKYVVQMTQGTRYHSQEILLVHDGTTVSMVEYADIYTESDLGTVDASISGDLVQLKVSPNYTNTVVRTERTEIKV